MKGEHDQGSSRSRRCAKGQHPARFLRPSRRLGRGAVRICPIGIDNQTTIPGPAAQGAGIDSHIMINEVY